MSFLPLGEHTGGKEDREQNDVQKQNQNDGWSGLRGTSRGSDGKRRDFLGESIQLQIHRGFLPIGNCLRQEARCQPICRDQGSRGAV